MHVVKQIQKLVPTNKRVDAKKNCLQEDFVAKQLAHIQA